MESVAVVLTVYLIWWLACAYVIIRVCGLAVGIMWPGTLSISSQKCPRGGTAMFALPAPAGDFGATVSPTLEGHVSEMAGGNLKVGLLSAAAFPVLLVISLLFIRKMSTSDC